MLAELAPVDRAVVVLRFWEDRSVADTAAQLDLTEAAVKNRSVRALRALRGLVDDTSSVRGWPTRAGPTAEPGRAGRRLRQPTWQEWTPRADAHAAASGAGVSVTAAWEAAASDSLRGVRVKTVVPRLRSWPTCSASISRLSTSTPLALT